jgi:hypothetical protein
MTNYSTIYRRPKTGFRFIVLSGFVSMVRSNKVPLIEKENLPKYIADLLNIEYNELV